jgi:peptidoglycan/LPS O-acetylase OafA/YrhL
VSDAAPVLSWAALLTALAAGLFAWTPDAELQWGPFALAALAAWGIGLALLRRRSRPVRTRPPRASGAAFALGVGIAVALNGLLFGWWLALVGGVVAIAAAAALVRESR